MRDARVDLHALIGADTALTRAANGRHGIEYAGRCPFCGGTDRLRVQPEWDGGRWWCRRCSGSDHWGDAADYLARRDNLSLGEALDRARGLPASPPRPAPAPDDAPSAGWRRSVGGLIDAWQEALWAPGGARALAWLRARGLRDETLRAARLGYIAADAPPASDLAYQRGIAIPVYAVDGSLYGVSIRRPVPRDARGGSKYVSVRGSRKALYGRVGHRDVLVVTEGYLDCLLAAQEVGDLADVATMNLGTPSGKWVRYLAQYPRILVCLDADEAGRNGIKRWDWMPRVRPVSLPAGKDITAAHVDHGVDLRAWLAPQIAPPAPWDDAESERLVGLLVAWGAAHAHRWEQEGVGDRMDAICEARDMAALRTLHARATGEREGAGHG